MRTFYFLYFIRALCLLSSGFLVLSCSPHSNISEYAEKSTTANIEPDYTDLTIPPNISPMNFTIQEKGDRFLVHIYADSSRILRLESASPQITIPVDEWSELLDANKGGRLYFDIFVQDGQWFKYKRFSNTIAHAPIDRYLVYRFLRPNYTVQKEIQIRQRDLQSFNEEVVMTTKTIAACVNCHNFNQNDPADMLFHIRWGTAAGTILAQGGKLTKVDTRTEFNTSPGAYPSWHPSGISIAFSVNRVHQFFHATGSPRDVIDLTSDIIIYQTESQTVVVEPKIAGPDFMETFPNWSPDGRYLYFCRTPQLGPDFDVSQEYRSIKYDLVRIGYDPDTEEWGEPETLISAEQTKQSCSQPRISPDGRFLLFCMADYGNFPIFHNSADLYLMDLQNKTFQRIKANSDRPEGYHSWSSNGRWIVFTSKRDNGLFTRLYFSYVDSSGQVHKPFLLPLKKPDDYQTIFKAFSIPELITDEIPYRPQHFINVALDTLNERRARLAPNSKTFPLPVIGQSDTATDFP